MEITFTAGFIGLGLIGGSIARALKKYYPNVHILAHTRSTHTTDYALEHGIIDEICDCVDERYLKCDYIFLCAPVECNASYLKALKPYLKKGCILTDVGSTKTNIHKKVEELALEEFFIGGHPMAGSEKTGIENAKAHLLENAYYVLTPASKVSQEMIDRYYELVASLKAIPLILTYEKHDYVTAAISHLPHIIASTLVNAVQKMDTPEENMKLIAAGGFKDITRIASSNPVVWEHILLSNPKNIVNGLKEYIELLNKMIYDIERNDAKDINAFFESSREYRDSIPNNTSGVIRMQYELFVDIPDEPGALAKVTVLLADAGINLKNFGISHNREDEEGVLRLSFYDTDACRKAFDLLADAGYRLYNR